MIAHETEEKLARLERKLARERRARQEAERLLEDKSRELFLALQKTEAARQELAVLANNDPLTQVLNRRGLEDAFATMSQLNSRCAATLGLALIDLNDFKRINDSLGHSVGDLVLEVQSARLRQRSRAHDRVARLGGDEFIIISPTALSDRALSGWSSNLAQSLAEPIEVDARTIKTSASVGVALAEPGESLDTVIKRADQQMYTHKASSEYRLSQIG